MVWDTRNEAHIAEHQVIPAEVEELIFADAPHYRRGPGKDIYHVYGFTGSGRYLFLVLRYLGKSRGRVITARDMAHKERRLYLHMQRR